MDPAYRRLLDALRAERPRGTPAARLAEAEQKLGVIMTGYRRPFGLYQVTGSKGKSTTAYFLAQLLHQPALFTSPHAFSVRERAAVGCRPASEAALARHVGPYTGAPPFQALFLGAMSLFREQQNTISNVVCEVGIGGWRDVTSRLNSHNRLVRNKVLLLGQVELEHCDYLGDTLYQIAADKTRLTDAACDRVVLHHANAANPEVYAGVHDSLRAIGLSPRLVHVPPPTGDVFRDCLEMAKAAAGVRGRISIVPYSPGDLYRPPPGPGYVRMLPAHCTALRAASGNFAFIDGAHTPNSIDYALKRYRDTLCDSGLRSRPTVIVFSQTRASRDYKRLLEPIFREFNNKDASFVVMTPPATFDLAYQADQVTPAEDALNNDVAEYIASHNYGVTRIRGCTELRVWLGQLVQTNILAIGSSHSAAAVLWVLEGQ